MPRSTRIRSVDVHPQLWPSRQLVRRGASVEEFFAKQASAVAQLYSMHLAVVAPVPALTWWVRFAPVERASDADSAFAGEPAEVTWGEGEVFSVLMDPAILTLPDDQRPRAYLDWLQAHLLRLAQARAWPTAGFEQAYALCLADDVRLTWQGPPKTSPDRRLTATPEYRFDEHGDCWATIALHDRADRLLLRSEPWDCYPELTFVKRSARSLRWDRSAAVEIETWPAEFAEAWGVASRHRLSSDGTARPGDAR